MANTIASAVRYINNDAELQKIFKAVSYTADFEKPNVAVGAKTVKYKRVSFGSSVLGTYNRETGYTRTDINISWVEKELTQDKGNSLMLDKMDSEETQATEIASVHNKWVRDVMIPAVDTYRFAQIAGATGVVSPTAATLSTGEDVAAAIDVALDTLYDKNATEGLVLCIATPAYRLLENYARQKGTLGLGNWNGDLSAEVLMYGNAKVKKVPSAILGAKVNFIVTPAAAIAAMVKYQENEFFDKIPGYGARKAEVDSGIYHDCWVEPGAEAAVYVHKHA